MDAGHGDFSGSPWPFCTTTAFCVAEGIPVFDHVEMQATRTEPTACLLKRIEPSNAALPAEVQWRR